MYNYNGESEADFNQLQKYYEIAIIKAKIKQERYFRRLWLFLIFILVVASCYLLNNHSESVSTNKALLALAITWLGLLPSLQYLSDRKRPPIPFFPLVGLFYATGFGLPMFSKHLSLSGRLSLANVSEQALILALLGILGMNIAFYVSKSFLWQKVTPIQLSGSYSRSKLLTLLWLFLWSHIAFLYIPFIQTIPSLGQLLIPIGYVSYGMFYIIWSRGQLSSIQTRVFLGICCPLECIQRLGSGSLAQMMTLGLFMVVVIWYERNRIPVVFISVTLLFFIILNPVKGEYRSLTWGKGTHSQANPIEKVQLFIDTTIKYYSKFGAKSQEQGSVDSTTERTTYINLFSNVIEYTPIIVPYWGGTTYSNLLTSYIPRALWPDKPIENIGNVFGKRYKYLNRNDNSTSVNLPWMVEMYVNFGTSGVLIGMPLVGMFLAFLEQKLNSLGMDPLEVVIGATVLFTLITQESNFSLMVGGLFNITVALYILFRFFLGGQPQKPL